ncbi:MAG TPA: hypothetical protein VKR43_11120 [Bryobacteraceae bacterium]|nr:hypothetical protein [Bryobacteraceae bacterium]
MSSPWIPVAAVAMLLVAIVYLARRSRRRCPYRNPLCRANRPCLLCYRELFKSKVAKAG